MAVARQPPRGHGTAVAGAPVVVQLGRPAGTRRARRVEAPDRLLRMWSLLNAANQELHQVKLPPEAAPRLQQLLDAVRTDLERSVSPDLAGELHRLTRWPPGPRTPDELRVECVSLLGWAGGLVLAMLGQLDAARLRQHLDKENLPAAPAAAARDRSVR